jgi:hypothetical protein
MAYWNPMIYQREDLLVQHVLLRTWGDGLSAGHLPISLVSLLVVNGYNHILLYVGTWGPFDGSAPIWCVQVILYEKELSYSIRLFNIRSMLHPRLPLMSEFKRLLIKP